MLGSSTQHVRCHRGYPRLYHGIKDRQGAPPGFVVYHRQVAVSFILAVPGAVLVAIVDIEHRDLSQVKGLLVLGLALATMGE